jgi:hypothetical protein
MEDSLKKLAHRRLSKDIGKPAMDAMTAFVANNPGAQHEDLVRKALEMGFEPNELIDQSLGSVMVDKGGLNLSRPLEDLLNESYGDNPIGGSRYVIDPNQVSSSRAKEVASELGKDRGVSIARGKTRAKPDFVAVKDATNETDKLRALPVGGHELKHSEDFLIRPGFEGVEQSGKIGHHYGPGTYESQELIRQVRDLPQDDKVLKEIAKRSDNIPTSLFSRLRSVPLIGPAIGLGAAALSQDASAAIPILSEADNLGPEVGSEDFEIENPQASPEARRAVLEQLKRPRR